MGFDGETVQQYRALIAVAEACHRTVNPSHSWHVFEWMAIKLRRKFPLARKDDAIINFDTRCC